MKTEIYGIFQTPVYITELNRSFTKKELNFVEKNKLNIYGNEGNVTSKDINILENKIFKNIKEEINITIKDYFDKIICTNNDVTPYITQSWLNYTNEKQYHHKHSHSNSLVSGVLYFNADEKYDKINFYRDKHLQISLTAKKYNQFNSEAWWFPVKTSKLILFPSELTHAVETKEGSNIRISLAFNVFIKGTIGNKFALTELNI